MRPSRLLGGVWTSMLIVLGTLIFVAGSVSAQIPRDPFGNRNASFHSGALAPVPTSADQPTVGGASAVSTRFVLLRNDHVLSGHVITRGSLVTVRKDRDAEITVRADQVVAVRDDLSSLFVARQAFKRRGSRFRLNELLDDAGWCVDQGMPGKATELLMAIYQVVPNHPIAIQLESRLRRKMSGGDGSVETTSETPVSHASFQAEQPTSQEGLSPSLSLAETRQSTRELHAFASRIQAILLSRCGHCHRESTDRQWTLVLPQTGNRVPRRGTIANFERTLAYCEPGDPDASELLRFAAMDHGRESGGQGNASVGKHQPPIADHEQHLFRTLRDWVSYLPASSVEPMSVDGEEPFTVGVDNISEPAFSESHISAPESGMDNAQVGAMVTEGMDRGKLIAAAPADVQAALAPPPVPVGSPVTSPIASSTEPVVKRASPSNLPQRLPVVENPNDVRYFNRQTELQRQLGL